MWYAISSNIFLMCRIVGKFSSELLFKSLLFKTMLILTIYAEYNLDMHIVWNRVKTFIILNANIRKNRPKEAQQLFGALVVLSLSWGCGVWGFIRKCTYSIDIGLECGGLDKAA